MPLDRSAAEYTPEPGNIDRGYVQTWNVAFERRVAYDIAVDVAYVGAKGTDGYAALDINAPTVLGTGNQGRPFFSLGRTISAQLVGRPAEDRCTSRCRSSHEQAVHARAAVQGRLHAQQVDERERRRRPRDAQLEHAERAGPQLRAGRASIAGTTSRWASRMRCRGRATAAITTTSWQPWSTTGRSTACSRRSAARRSP